MARGPLTRAARRGWAGALALTLALCAVPPARAADDVPSDTTANARAVDLLQHGCGAAPENVAGAQVSGSPEPVAVAQVISSPEPLTSPSPSASPLVGPPSAPSGPQILLPPLPSASPGTVTPPPIPTVAPVSAGSPGPVIIEPISAPPSSSPLPAPAVSAGPVGLPSPAASPSPSPGPNAEVLDPNTYAILGDRLTGVNKGGEPFDLDGHVNIFYRDGVLGGDHAHYDGQRYIDVTGHTFVRNSSGNTTLFADAVRFDETTQRATLIRGRGESTQGVEQGKLHFTGTSMVTERNGVTHVEHSFLTTCENPRGGYHLESKTLDIYPGDKAVAKSAVLFLGALAILYLPVAIISLRNDEPGSRRNPGFLPLVGYSAAEGFWIKARVGFSPSDNYYGYYRIEEYTRIGLGFGYVGTLKRKDGRRITDLQFYRSNDRTAGTTGTNLTLNDQEFFSRTTRATLGLNYTGNYGPLVSLPAQYDLSLAADHATEAGTHENYSFRRTSTSGQSSSNDYGFSDQRNITPRLSNNLTASYTTSDSLGYAHTTQLHYETLTHYSSNAFDYDLTYDRYDGTLQSNVEKEPELAIRPHNPLFARFKAFPITAQYTLGDYYDPSASLNTSRGEARLTLGPGLAHFLASDFNATVTIQQDAYGTGDLKAQIAQNASLTTTLFGHVINVISYTEQHVNGPLAEPFKSIDVLGNGSKQANDVLRIFNGDVYQLSLTATTFFNRQAQAVGYQLTTRPSSRSTLTLAGNFTPGPGFGFDRTNVQLTTPFGYQSDLQFQTDIDWKSRGRLENKDIYYRHVVGNCYEVRISYNEGLKQVTASVDLLAFPSRVVNFGLGQTSLSSIIPQSFSTSSFTGQ